MNFEHTYIDDTTWRKELATLTRHYEDMLQFVDRKLQNVPDGTLVVQTHGEEVEYYLKNDAGKVYLSKKDPLTIKQLAEKSYYSELKRVLEQQIKQNQNILSRKVLRTPKDVYREMRPERKALVRPVDSGLEEYIAAWEKEPYEGKEFIEGAPEYYARNGLRVRSKSETTIADLLLEYETPFRYESELQLRGLGLIHPDFIVLNRRTGEEYIWEHFGKVDDWKYANDMVKRIEAYHFNGYYEGKNLIYTLESAKKPFGPRDARRIIEEYLI